MTVPVRPMPVPARMPIVVELGSGIAFLSVFMACNIRSV
jgi:hypothetical protein